MQMQSQITGGRGLIQRNSSGLLKPLESVASMKALSILRRSFRKIVPQSRRPGDLIKPLS
jgi:hypothetical protein